MVGYFLREGVVRCIVCSYVAVAVIFPTLVGMHIIILVAGAYVFLQ